MLGFKRRGARIRELERVLNWYADESHWRRRAINSKGSPRRWEKSPAAKDRGARARRVMGSWSKDLFIAMRKAFGLSPRQLIVNTTPTVRDAIHELVDGAETSATLPLVQPPRVTETE